MKSRYFSLTISCDMVHLIKAYQTSKAKFGIVLYVFKMLSNKAIYRDIQCQIQCQTLY